MDERQKITKDSLTKHNFIIRDYFLRGIVLTSDFLDDLKEMDPFMYDRLANRENIPKDVIDWFKYKIEEDRKWRHFVLTSDFLNDLKEIDPFMYDRFVNHEDIPKDVIDWFKCQTEEKRKGKFTARKTNAF